MGEGKGHGRWCVLPWARLPSLARLRPILQEIGEAVSSRLEGRLNRLRIGIGDGPVR